MSRLRFSDEARVTHASKCPPLAMAGGALMVISGLLSWSFDNRILDDISIRFYPAGIQIYSMMFGVLALILGVLLLRRPPWMSPARWPAHPRHHRAGASWSGCSARSPSRPVG